MKLLIGMIGLVALAVGCFMIHTGLGICSLGFYLVLIADAI